MDNLYSISGIISLLTLTLMEIVLGIDNIIFVSIAASKLPDKESSKARIIGLSLAMILRILLLLGIVWLTGLTQHLFTVAGFKASFKDLILAAGGLFLLAKSTGEIHSHIEGKHNDVYKKHLAQSIWQVVFQILIMDIIFSFDSILTAIGLSGQIVIMIVAIIIALILMMIFAGRVSRFIERHPTIKMLALAFLLLIGFMLILEALHYEVPKGYIYFAISFSLFIELLNMRRRKKKEK